MVELAAQHSSLFSTLTLKPATGTMGEGVEQATLSTCGKRSTKYKVKNGEMTILIRNKTGVSRHDCPKHRAKAKQAQLKPARSGMERKRYPWITRVLESSAVGPESRRETGEMGSGDGNTRGKDDDGTEVEQRCLPTPIRETSSVEPES